MSFKRKVYEVLELKHTRDEKVRLYDMFMLFTIFLSILPLFFKEINIYFIATDIFCACVFIIDYLARWYTSELKLKKGQMSYIIYPFTPFAIIDLLSILPTIGLINGAFRLFRVLRVFKLLKIFRVLKHSKSFKLIISVIQHEKEALMSVGVFIVSYILITALVMFNVEPSNFETFFDSLYWATITLTTIGYGDIVPISTVGKVFSMLSSIVGIAMIALPSGIITAGFIQEIERRKKRNNKKIS